MRKYCTTLKNKAYIFLEVIIISFLFISLTLFLQILLNNSFKLYKVDYETQENFQNLDFLNEIMKAEIRNIEKNINDGSIKNAVDYIVLNEAGEKIFLTADPSRKISLGGYTLLNDEIKISIFNSVNIHFKKKISIKDKNYLILATVKYEVGSSRDLGSLYNGVLTRMWIKEDV
ncbi:hypothetical protein [Fusobacterium pseudoperiodonticum]|uniref:Uncharacterized protein n=1 Tax=Fusobacterium pseudoperiodonticum TaxID=2663009 RepID=A0A2D3NVZ8_9FUSO|nr:hypothetical protein [Fusobacterium pseudoperiodonticum]ATV59510.1 hypothetical protein CTM72_07155 [Fusobacterium pseudoperiodonticum]